MKFLSRVTLLMTVSLAACNIFETRNPESPVQTSSNFTPPFNASDVFDNMQFAFSELNTEHYVASFSDGATGGRTFDFEPSPQARSEYTGVFLSWTRQSEQQYFSNMKVKIAVGATPSLSFSLNPISIQSDSVQYDANYQMTIPHTQANIPKVFQGRAQFFLIKDPMNSYWSIWRWIDFRDAQNDTSWSDLKGAFAQ